MSLVDLKLCDINSMLTMLCFALPFYPSLPSAWLLTVEDYANNSESLADNGTPMDLPPNVHVIGTVAFSSLMKQGCFWGSLLVSDLVHAEAHATYYT